jgi:hypothetical protein
MLVLAWRGRAVVLAEALGVRAGEGSSSAGRRSETAPARGTIHAWFAERRLQVFEGQLLCDRPARNA